MCGIAGFFDPRMATDAEAQCRRMLDAVTHRGPDDEGLWTDAAAGICLGHRRLSIVDLTPTGHQPMSSHSGRYVIVFNGEIYNAGEIRERLDAGDGPRKWRGHSDTEVALEAFEAFGVEDALRQFYGMFAIALWDREARTLHLSRDRFGEKPLYWGWQGGSLLFASELKAIHRHRACERRVDVRAVASFLERGYVPAPLSIYEGISKVAPGTVLSFRLDGGVSAEPRSSAYWSLMTQVASAKAELASAGPVDWVDALDRALTRAVSRQMVSDVPLGAFLSGGIDSSLIVSTMQRLSPRPVKTFTIGFREMGFDESSYAEQIARTLGTDHTVQYVSPRDALDVIPRLPHVYDEPFADDSQIPTALICRLARTKVTVALSGDAGDEVFGGYNRYFHGVGLWERTRRIPRPLRSAAAAAAESFPHWLADAMGSALGRVVPRRRRVPQLANKLYKGLRLLKAETVVELGSALLSRWAPSDLPLRAREPGSMEWPVPACAAPLPLVEQFMCLDALTYLPDDILVKVDRAAMATSLETRVPFLDPEVVALAWSMPLDRKVQGSSGKVVLKQLLARRMPPSLFERPKAGFGLPVGAWLRGPLREWGGDLLESPRPDVAALLDVPRVSALWRRHQSGVVDAAPQLWPVLMLAGWFQEWSRS